MQKIAFLLIFILVLTEGCSVLKRSEKTGPGSAERNMKIDDAGSIILNNLSENNFFIRKAEINVTNNNVTAGFTATIRFKLPDSLLISVKSKLGIEAVRALLTRDTILINDKVNKKLLSGNPKALEAKYGVHPAVIFALLGDFVIDKKDESRKVDCRNGIYKDSFILREKKVDYTVDCKRKKVTGAYFEGTLNTGNITLKYSNFKNMDGIPVPQKIDMIDDLSSMTVNMEIEKAEIGWNGEIKFVPGNDYEVVHLK